MYVYIHMTYAITPILHGESLVSPFWRPRRAPDCIILSDLDNMEAGASLSRKILFGWRYGFNGDLLQKIDLV